MEMEQVMCNQISNQHCLVNLSVEVNRNDFVIVQDENRATKVAKVEQVFGRNNAHVVWYLRPDELPHETELKSDNGLNIKFHEKELIASSDSCNIKLNEICGKCMVFKAHENDSVTDIFAQLNNKYAMAYVYRYKLVKETRYKLVPVSWEPGEEEGASEMSDAFTDTEDYNENVCNLSATISELHLSLTKNSKYESSENKVPPIKIINGKEVQKVTCKRSQIPSSKKRSSPDAAQVNDDVSPSKRNKSISSYDSPSTRSGKYTSPTQKKMNKIRKNLNESFIDASELEEEPKSPYTVNINPKQPLTMTIMKKGKEPLREHNAINTPIQRPQNKRLSILKTNTDSTKRTPKRSSVGFVDPPKMDAVEETTPKRYETRRKKETSDAITASVMEQSTPSPEKPPSPRRTRKSMAKKLSPPSTPKSASKRATAAKTPRTPKTPKEAGVLTPQQSRSLYRSGNLTPSIQSRQEVIGGDQTELEMIRERLQVSAVPSSLPCREKEYSSIYEFIMGKLSDGSGGCIYISGVPGTGKTATVTQVIKTIQKESNPKRLPAFDYVDINGMRLTEPRQAYVQIYRQLTGKTLAWAQARDLLEARFTAGSKKAIRSTILLVDELDIICNRKQDVVYNLFDWTVRKGSRLIAITIANTMDLPERVLKLKVASRLGLTRITFQPYSFKQLQEVVMTRLAGSNCFMADAVQLVARKVASVSGDCRRALDICRRATEIAEEKRAAGKAVEVNFAHINQALSEMFASPKVRAIKNCTTFEKLFLQAVASEITRTGIEEVEFHRVYWQIGTLAPVLGIKNPPNEDQAMRICMTLAANRLLIAEDSSTGQFQKIILNATVDDLYYALNVN